MRRLTKPQQLALKRLYERSHTPSLTYLRFRRRVTYPPYDECVMVPWCGMWMGIEKDGYTHS